MKEITIKTNNPQKTDELLQNFGILMEQGYPKNKKGNYKARCLSDDTNYAKFAIKHQGYLDVEIID